jgi:regulator of protease activity HflC (stomatin/prohibitin superfamily)
MRTILTALLLLASAASTGCTETVNPGEVGVAVYWGETQSWVYPEGFHFTSPWMTVVHMSTRTQAYEMGVSGTPGASGAESSVERGESISVLTQDQLSVQLSATVQFHLNASTAPMIYRMYGESYADTIIHPLVRTAIRDAASSFSAIDLVDQRPRLQTTMEENVQQRLEEALNGRNIPTNAVVIENILLQNIDLPESLDASIAAVQQQRQQTVQRQQALLTAQAEADRLRTEADGEAAATRIRAEAQADANRALAASLTPAVLEQHRIEATLAILSDANTRTVMVPSSGLSLMMPNP